MIKIEKICTARHTGTLKEMLETEKEITWKEYLEIQNEYNYYVYDERIKAHRLVIKNMKENYKKKREWINIYML